MGFQAATRANLPVHPLMVPSSRQIRTPTTSALPATDSTAAITCGPLGRLAAATPRQVQPPALNGVTRLLNQLELVEVLPQIHKFSAAG